MKSRVSPSGPGHNPTISAARLSPRERGSVLVTALLLAFAIGAGVVGYLKLAHGTLVNSERTHYRRNAAALAEAGLEEALYSFHQLDAGQATAAAWSGWTIAGANASRELPAFNCDQNAVGTVRVYVAGCDGKTASPLVTAQARIAPFDGSAPVLKTLQIKLQKSTGVVPGVVARNGLTWKGQASADSFNSNPSGNPNGPWLPYTSALAQANTTVIVPAGTISLGAQCAIAGNVALGAGVAPPPASQVSGQIITNYTGTFPLPAYPTAAGVSKSYSLGKTVPATLPRATDTAAADGRYYYFLEGATVANTTIAAGKKVTFVGHNTGMQSGLRLQTGASCFIYLDGPIAIGSNGANNQGGGNGQNDEGGSNNDGGDNSGGNGGIANPNWAGALQIFTSTAANCSIGGSAAIYACVYAPNAALTCNGGGSSGLLVGSFVASTISSTGHMDFHYDEALNAGSGLNGPWTPGSWFDLQSAADRATVASLTGGYLR